MKVIVLTAVLCAAAGFLMGYEGRQPQVLSVRAPAQAPAQVETRAKVQAPISKSSDPVNSFPASEAGQKVVQLTALRVFGSMVGAPEAQQFAEQAQWLKEHPREAFVAIQAAVLRFDESRAADRQYLVQFAAKLGVGEREKMAFLARELKRSGKGAAQFNASAALSAMLELAPGMSPSGPSVYALRLSKFAISEIKI